MRNGLKTALFLSAFSPVLLSLACVKYLNDGPVDDVAYYAAAGAIGISLTIAIIGMIKKNGEIIAFTAKKIESNDALLLGVVASYFIPFVAKASEITMSTIVAIAAVATVILWFMSSIPPHPLLRVLSFRFYKVESANGVVYTLISKRELLDPKDIRRVKRISSSMLMEMA
jgi:hypothetical protein